MSDTNRRAILTGLAAIAAVGIAPAPAAAHSLPRPSPPGEPEARLKQIHRYFERADAARWEFWGIGSQTEQVGVFRRMRASVWHFDPNMQLPADKRVFTVHHVESGLTFQQCGPQSKALNYLGSDPEAELSTCSWEDFCIAGHSAWVAFDDLTVHHPDDEITAPVFISFPDEPYEFFTPPTPTIELAPPLRFFV
jgi:hypothetical protein